MTVKRCNYMTNPLLFGSVLVPALDEILSEANSMATKAATKGWNPATDVIESKDAYYVRIDLPGVSKDKLCINFDEFGDLVISSNSVDTVTENEDGLKYLVKERHDSMAFEKRIKLGKDADIEHVEAKLVDGVLEIRIARILPTKKTIAIN